MKTPEEQIKSLIRKAADAHDASEAMKYAQAALSAAHAANLMLLTGS